VSFHRLNAEAKLLCDVFVENSILDHSHDFYFPAGKLVLDPERIIEYILFGLLNNRGKTLYMPSYENFMDDKNQFIGSLG